MATARSGLERLNELEREGTYPHGVLDLHRTRLEARLAEFKAEAGATHGTRKTELYRRAHRELLETQRAKLIDLRARGKIDNTVLRELQRIFDLEWVETQALDLTGHADIEK
jgi:hypothetical protein